MTVTGNFVLDRALLAWFVAQVIKVALEMIVNRTFDPRKFIASGGMPSSHSALVVACTASVWRLEGLASPLFGVSALVAAVVMYDACNVRRSAGDTAKLVNQLLAHLEELTAENLADDLKIIMGHTPLQVLMGALLGLAIGILL